MLLQDVPLDMVRVRRGAGAAQLCQLWHGGRLGGEGTVGWLHRIYALTAKWRVKTAAVVKAAAFLKQGRLYLILWRLVELPSAAVPPGELWSMRWG